MQSYDLRTLRSTLWLASVVNFESSDLRTRDRQREELERVDLLFLDLDGTCRDYTYLRQSELH